MNASQFRDFLVQSEAVVRMPSHLRSARLRDLKEAEQRYGRPLPEFYRVFAETMGGSSPVLFDQNDFRLSNLPRFEKIAVSMIEEFGVSFSLVGCFVFGVGCQDGVFVIGQDDVRDDPDVVVFDSEGLQGRSQFSQMIIELLNA